MKGVIKKLENTILKTLNSLSENSLNDGYFSPDMGHTAVGESMMLVWSTCRISESDRENNNPIE